MLETIVIICLGVILYFYLQRKDDKKIIERQDYQLRKLKGIKNEDDELESKNLMEDHHFKMIIHNVQQDELFKDLDRDTQIDEARRLFENKYGTRFSDPFNEY